MALLASNHSAGELRKRVRLQQPGGTQDATGERLTTFADVATVWANVKPLTGRSALIAAERQSSATHTVTVRYNSITRAIASSWRLRLGERVFVINAPPKNVDEADTWIELDCVEGLANE
jgi:SPP1 family predicted phage head-tail adaptor